MNWLRRFSCWWYGRHVPIKLFTPGYRVTCVRCGATLAEHR